MTSTVKVQSHNHPVLVEFFDRHDDTRDWKKTDYKTIHPVDGEQTFYVSTTRKIVVYDIEPLAMAEVQPISRNVTATMGELQATNILTGMPQAA